MRFLHLTNYYEQWLRQLYERRPDLHRASYAEQQAQVIGARLGWSDYLVRNLSALGYEADLVVANNRAAQTQWAHEHGLPAGVAPHGIVIEQINAFAPDVILFEDSFSFSAEFVREVRRRVPSVRHVLAYLGLVRLDADLLSEADLALTCAHELTAAVRRNGGRAETMLHAFETTILQSIDRSGPAVDVSFVGSIFPGYHDTRYALLERLVNAGVPLEVYTGAFDRNPAELMKYIGRALRSSPSALRWWWGPVRKVSHSPRSGIDMFSLLAHSAISLNVHGDPVSAFAANMRLFEITGCGACLVTDWRPNLTELLADGTEIVTYRTDDECVEKVKWLLDHETERRRIAAAGQARTLREHTFHARCVDIDSHIRSLADRGRTATLKLAAR